MLVPVIGTAYNLIVKIVGAAHLITLQEREDRKRPQDARALRKALSSWKQEVSNAGWTKPTDVQAKYGSADAVGQNRIVFNICGNKYRLVVKFNYIAQVARVRFAGTHAEYDMIDAREV